MTYHYNVDAGETGLIAGEILRRHFGLSGTHLRQIRVADELRINGALARLNTRVQAGDYLAVDDRLEQADLAGLARRAESAGISVCFQDEWLLVLNKPAGMLVHPSAGAVGPSVLQTLDVPSLHFYNRLDRDTSGLVLITAAGPIQHRLRRLPVDKHYLALVHGTLQAPDGLIQLPLRRVPESLVQRETHPDGQPARTQWHVLDSWPDLDLSWVSFQLHTGRTHQIRVHAAASHVPLVGESLYTDNRNPDVWDRLVGRQALHAARMSLSHPVTGQLLVLEAPLPSDMERACSSIRAASSMASEPAIPPDSIRATSPSRS